MSTKEFSDKSILMYENGEFNKYRICYIRYGKEKIVIDGRLWLKALQRFFRKNKGLKNMKGIIFAHRKIYDIDTCKLGIPDITPSNEDFIILDKIVDKYYNKYLFKPDKLSWQKIVYLTLFMYYAEDNWKNQGKRTIFGRSIYGDEFYRVLLEEDVDNICKLYTGKSITEIYNLIGDTNGRIDILTGEQQTIENAWK